MATRLDLCYGNSQAGKTTWGLQIAEHLYVKKGLKTRWYLGDGGGETIYSSGLVDEGIVEVLQFNLRPQPFATMQLCCDGYWPKNVNDPASKLEKVVDFTPFGLFVYEGLSVGCDYMMGDQEGGLANRAAKGEKIGQDTPFVVMEDGLKFGGNPPSHYGFTQRRLLSLIERTRALPLPFVLWTAHQRKAEDSDLKGVYEFGPDCAGQALTSKIGGSFGNTIHMHQVTVKKKEKDALTGQQIDVLKIERRAYTRKHADPEGQTGIKYYANSRMPREFVDEMPEYLAPPDAVKFYQILESAKLHKVDRLAKLREEAQKEESQRLVNAVDKL
jgi:hypothetical protein